MGNLKIQSRVEGFINRKLCYSVSLSSEDGSKETSQKHTLVSIWNPLDLTEAGEGRLCSLLAQYLPKSCCGAVFQL